MLNVTKELTALARKLGYTGEAPDTVAKAINAITSVAGSSSPFIVEAEQMQDDRIRLNKTWKEINDAFLEGKICIFAYDQGRGYISTVFVDPEVGYMVVAGNTGYRAESENDYPIG